MNTQISKITTLFLNYPKMLQVWNATDVSSNFASADFRKIKTYNFQKS